MRYKVNTKFVFEGYFEIEADNRNEAKRLVGENCGLVMGGNIHTNLDDEEVDWLPTTMVSRKVVHSTPSAKQMKVVCRSSIFFGSSDKCVVNS